MVEKIVQYRTKQGTVYDTKEEAEHHENIHDFIDNMVHTEQLAKNYLIRMMSDVDALAPNERRALYKYLQIINGVDTRANANAD